MKPLGQPRVHLLLPDATEVELVPPGDEAYVPTDLRKDLREALARLEQASIGKLALKAIQQANFLKEVLATILAGKRGLKKLGLKRLRPLDRRQQLGVRYALHQAVTHAPELVMCNHPGLRKETKQERGARDNHVGAPCPTCGLLVEGMRVRAAFLRLQRQKDFLEGRTEEVAGLLADYKKGRVKRARTR